MADPPVIGGLYLNDVGVWLLIGPRSGDGWQVMWMQHGDDHFLASIDHLTQRRWEEYAPIYALISVPREAK